MACKIHRADIGNLKMKDDRLVLEVWGKGRTSADADIVIPAKAEKVVREWLAARKKLGDAGDDKPLFVSLSRRSYRQRISLVAIRVMAKKYFESVGAIGNKSAHSLRHSAITAAIKGGATPIQVQQMARHSSFDTTLGYFHETNRLANPAEDVIYYGE